MNTSKAKLRGARFPGETTKTRRFPWPYCTAAKFLLTEIRTAYIVCLCVGSMVTCRGHTAVCVGLISAGQREETGKIIFTTALTGEIMLCRH